MLLWVFNKLKTIVGYGVSLGNPSDSTSELRLIAFGIFVILAVILIWMEFQITHRINNTALGTLAGAVTGGAFSMRQ
jgi:lipoprotein signal peptidase